MVTETTLPFWKAWTWMHWLVIALVLVISVKEVYGRQVQRLKQIDQQQVSVIEEDIQEYNTMAERLAQLEVLPPVKKQWDFVTAITGKYGVQLKVLGVNTPGSQQRGKMYEGPLAAWNAELVGSTISVLVAAQEIQNTVPTYLYQFSIRQGEATLGISVLGSE